MGHNGSGILGLRDSQRRHSPTRIFDENVSSVDIAGEHAHIMMTDGSIYLWAALLEEAWGENTSTSQNLQVADNLITPVDFMDSKIPVSLEFYIDGESIGSLEIERNSSSFAVKAGGVNFSGALSDFKFYDFLLNEAEIEETFLLESSPNRIRKDFEALPSPLFLQTDQNISIDEIKIFERALSDAEIGLLSHLDLPHDERAFSLAHNRKELLGNLSGFG